MLLYMQCLRVHRLGDIFMMYTYTLSYIIFMCEDIDISYCVTQNYLVTITHCLICVNVQLIHTTNWPGSFTNIVFVLCYAVMCAPYLLLKTT